MFIHRACKELSNKLLDLPTPVRAPMQLNSSTYLIKLICDIRASEPANLLNVLLDSSSKFNTSSDQQVCQSEPSCEYHAELVTTTTTTIKI